MRKTVKTDLKLSSLKPKKRQHLTVLQQQKRADRACRLWNLLKYGMQKGEIVFQTIKYSLGGKVQSTKRQRAGQTLRGCSWKHVNRLSPPQEAIICHGLGCSVKNLEISSDFCETGWQSQNKYVHRIYVGPCLALIWKKTSKMKIWPSDRTVLPLTYPIKSNLGANTTSNGARQCGLLHRPISTQWTSVEVHVWNWDLSLITHNCGVVESVFG